MSNSQLFVPKLKLKDVEELFYGDSYGREKELKSSEAHSRLEQLTRAACPSLEDASDRRWDFFYLPLERRKKLITIPLSVLEYKSDFYIWLQNSGHATIKEGQQRIDRNYIKLLDEVARFIPVMKATNNKIVETAFPFDIRHGRIKGKYVAERVIPREEREAIEADYQRHAVKGLSVQGISLNDYLNTAAICYTSAFKRAKGLTPLEMYNCWADKRHGGMLDIKNPNSEEEFAQWLHSSSWSGSHPFEIVFSWIEIGINLLPPAQDSPYFKPVLSNYDYAGVYLEMVKGLIDKNVPFAAGDFAEVLDYLTGESWFGVNTRSIDSLQYSNSREDRKKYFQHIEWEPIEFLKWK